MTNNSVNPNGAGDNAWQNDLLRTQQAGNFSTPETVIIKVMREVVINCFNDYDRYDNPHSTPFCDYVWTPQRFNNQLALRLWLQYSRLLQNIQQLPPTLLARLSQNIAARADQLRNALAPHMLPTTLINHNCMCGRQAAQIKGDPLGCRINLQDVLWVDFQKDKRIIQLKLGGESNRRIFSMAKIADKNHPTFNRFASIFKNINCYFLAPFSTTDYLFSSTPEKIKKILMDHISLFSVLAESNLYNKPREEISIGIVIYFANIEDSNIDSEIISISSLIKNMIIEGTDITIKLTWAGRLFTRLQ